MTIIITATRRQYWPNGVQKWGQLANVYFHCTAKCVKLMQPAFIPFLVVIPMVSIPIYKHHIDSTLQKS